MKYKKTLITILVVGLLVSSATLFAQDSESVLPTTPECPADIEVNIRTIKADFYGQLEKQLESADLNSESLNYLFRIYREHARNVRRLGNFIENDRENLRYRPGKSGACNDFINQAADEMRYVFVQAYTQIGARKKGFLLLEKLDSINTQLQKSQESFLGIQQDFQKFNDLFPCFTTQCVTN